MTDTVDGLDLPSAGEVFLSTHRLNDLDEDVRARVRGELVVVCCQFLVELAPDPFW